MANRNNFYAEEGGAIYEFCKLQNTKNYGINNQAKRKEKSETFLNDSDFAISNKQNSLTLGFLLKFTRNNHLENECCVWFLKEKYRFKQQYFEPLLELSLHIILHPGAQIIGKC